MVVKFLPFSLASPAFLLDVHAPQAEMLEQHVLKYSFKKKVAMTTVDEALEVQATMAMGSIPDDEEGAAQVWDEIGEPIDLGKDFFGGYISFVDPRVKMMGVRTYAPPDCFEVEEGIEQASVEQYHQLRILTGVPEGLPVQGMIPHHLNFHCLNTLAFDKGCYIGQELVARTHSAGQVRTHVFPFFVTDKDIQEASLDWLDSSFDEPLNNQPVLDSQGKQVGTVIDSSRNLGLAKIRAAKVTGETLHLQSGKRLVAWAPGWLDIGQS